MIVQCTPKFQISIGLLLELSQDLEQMDQKAKALDENSSSYKNNHQIQVHVSVIMPTICLLGCHK